MAVLQDRKRFGAVREGEGEECGAVCVFGIRVLNGREGTAVEWSGKAATAYDVYVNGTKRCHATASHCQLEGLRKCEMYAVVVVATGASLQCGRSIVFRVPPRGHTLCHSRLDAVVRSSLAWEPLLGGFSLGHDGPSRYLEMHVPGAPKVQHLGVSQLAVFREEVQLGDDGNYGVWLRMRTHREDGCSSWSLLLSVDLFFADGSAARNAVVDLQHVKKGWYVQSASFLCPKRLAAIRVSVLFSSDGGLVRISEISLRRSSVQTDLHMNLPAPSDAFFEDVQIRSLLASKAVARQDISLVVPLLVENLPDLFVLVKQWSGPIVGTVWIQAPSDFETVAEFRKFSELVRERVDFHLAERFPRVGAGQVFPSGFLRNVGLKKARSRFVFELDAGWQLPLNACASLKKTLALVGSSNVVVIPAFNASASLHDLPSTKRSVVDAYDGGLLDGDWLQWFQSAHPHRLGSLVGEDLFLLLDSEVWRANWDERFFGLNGAGRKARALLLLRAGADFVLEPEVFAVRATSAPGRPNKALDKAFEMEMAAGLMREWE